jgi:paraquat-inducible protein B
VVIYYIDQFHQSSYFQSAHSWNVSGLTVNAGISGVKIKAESLLSIAAGGIAVDQGNKNIKNRFKDGTYKLFDSFAQATQKPTNITLTFDQAHDLIVGSQVRLKGLAIGTITALTLNKNNNFYLSMINRTANVS